MQLILSTYTHKCFYSNFFAKTIQYKSHELFQMSKFLNYARGKYDHEIMEKKIHILPDIFRKTE